MRHMNAGERPRDPLTLFLSPVNEGCSHSDLAPWNRLSIKIRDYRMCSDRLPLSNEPTFCTYSNVKVGGMHQHGRP
jgi:hypothetical protein